MHVANLPADNSQELEKPRFASSCEYRISSYVVDRCSKMRPFSEAGKVKSSTIAVTKIQIIANICEHCGIVRSDGLSIVYF